MVHPDPNDDRVGYEHIFNRGLVNASIYGECEYIIDNVVLVGCRS